MATKRPAPSKENCLPSRHFDFNLDNDDFETMSKPFQPKNTQQSPSWVKERNKHKCQDKCPHDVLLTADKATLAYWLGCFVPEARRQDGQPYPPKTSELEKPSASVQPSTSVQPSSSVALDDPAAVQPHLPIQHPLPAWWQLQPPLRPCYPQQQTSCYNGCTFNLIFTFNIVQKTDSYLRRVNVKELFSDF